MYEDRILAFIDVLGFSSTINNTMKNGQENESETTRINNLIENVQWHLNYDTKSGKSKVVSQFSDSLIISYLKQEESRVVDILFDISHLCIAALQNGFLLRGAIVCDKVYHTEKKIFGPALVKAHEMERKQAIYPRIILDENIINIAGNYVKIERTADYVIVSPIGTENNTLTYDQLLAECRNRKMPKLHRNQYRQAIKFAKRFFKC